MRNVWGMDVLVEFVEVAIHCILYNRQLYPQGVFEKRIKYNVPVQMCLHPDVNSYIQRIMESFKLLLSKGTIDKLSVVILQQDMMCPVERFVFEIIKFSKSCPKDDPHLFEAEQVLRGFLLKLNVGGALLKDCSEDKTWIVHIHTQDSTFTSAEEEFIQNDFPWTKAEEREQTMKNAKLVPLRSAISGMFNMQLYVEEEGDIR